MKRKSVDIVTFKMKNIKDKHGNIRKEILNKMIEEIIDNNPLIYERLAKI